MLGAEVNAESHGAVDVAWRRGPWSVALFTETLDARYAPSWDRGRAWLALRAEGGAAGLMITPWEGGAPAPERALTASYVGPEAGVIAYGPGGLYGGVGSSARLWGFGAMEGTTIEVPPAQVRVVPEVVVGWWRPWLDVSARGGVTYAPASDVDAVQPHLAGSASLPRSDGPIWPRLEARAGVASGQDDVSTTRLGGLNPYVVPLAGATWAEFWVEDYAALRAGPSARVGPVTSAVVVDAAWFDGATAAGFGLLTDLSLPSGFAASLHVGYAPWLPRREPLGGLAGWFVVQQTFGPRDDPS